MGRGTRPSSPTWSRASAPSATSAGSPASCTAPGSPKEKTFAALALDRYPLTVRQQGTVGERDYEARLNRATCLGLLIKAIVAWNTRYLAAALEHGQATGHTVNDADLERLSPLLWEQINLHGSYHFDLNRRGGLRSLRSSRAPGDSWATDWVGERERADSLPQDLP